MREVIYNEEDPENPFVFTEDIDLLQCFYCKGIIPVWNMREVLDDLSKD